MYLTVSTPLEKAFLQLVPLMMSSHEGYGEGCTGAPEVQAAAEQAARTLEAGLNLPPLPLGPVLLPSLQKPKQPPLRLTG